MIEGVYCTKQITRLILRDGNKQLDPRLIVTVKEQLAEFPALSKTKYFTFVAVPRLNLDPDVLDCTLLLTPTLSV